MSEAVTIHERGGSLMFGVVSRPAVRTPRSRALVMLGKAGPGDIWRWIAESLASRGYIVLRFEPAGLGDSPGGNPGADMAVEEYFRGVQEGAFVQDTQDAVAWIARAYEPSAVSVLGVCGNCSSVLLAAAAMPSIVTSAILVTPAVLYSVARATIRNYEAKDLSRGYVSRLFAPAAYINLLTGQSDYRVIRTVLLWLLRRPLEFVRRAVARMDRSPRPNHPNFNLRLWEGLRAVVKQGKPVLCLVAELDAEALDFDTELKELVIDRDPAFSALCAVRLLPRTDHSFLFQEGRELARRAIVEWLETQASAARMSAAS